MEFQRGTPPIGLVVWRYIGDLKGQKFSVLDYVAQVRIGDEQSVLVWGEKNYFGPIQRFVAGRDLWQYVYFDKERKPYVAP